MSKRFAWLLGVVVLISIGLLAACGSKYKASSDGLVLVSSQGSQLLQSFSFSLSNGHLAGISNPPSTSGQPSAMVLDPAGAFAYVIIDQSSIAAFKVNSNGTMTAAGSTTAVQNAVALAMDSAGKFLFVAGGLSGVVSSYSIGSGGALTPAGGTLTLPATLVPPNLAALAVTPTVFPLQNAVCSTNNGNNSPTSEYLYAADSANNLVWEFEVDMSSGVLKIPPNHSEVPAFAADSVPSGVAVDPCNRFVYVSNTLSNRISAYSICNLGPTQSQSCPATADGSLVPVSGSPFSLQGGANGPGPLVVDPFGNYLYVVDTLSNMVSPFHISPVSGSLTSQTVVATGAGPKAIAIRSDDNWLFVTNFSAATLSQYSITPASGALTPLPASTTDNNPWGVAVK